jgi:hypothetical protein
LGEGDRIGHGAWICLHWSISRKSGHRFSAGNATSVTNLEHDPIREKRGML